MRRIFIASLTACVLASLVPIQAAWAQGGSAKGAAGQTPRSTDPEWRRGLMGLPGRPSARATPADVAQFERYVLDATPYFVGLTPGDYEANRELVRRMVAYMAALDAMQLDPQSRLVLGRARRAMDAWRIPPAFLVPGPAAAYPPPPVPGASVRAPLPPSEPPFALSPPDFGPIPEAGKSAAADLRERYQSVAAKAARAWKNADLMRRNLAAQGLSLNADASGALTRLPDCFDRAGQALIQHDWAEAQSNLDRADAESEKIFKSVGR